MNDKTLKAIDDNSQERMAEYDEAFKKAWESFIEGLKNADKKEHPKRERTEGMRTYFLEDPIHPNGGITINCKYDTDCVFCDHCTDIWWDYTNLIYKIWCEEGHDPSKRPCKYFVET